jgi:hypothetical protein
MVTTASTRAATATTKVASLLIDSSYKSAAALVVRRDAPPRAGVHPTFIPQS